ncbi:MAG: hypothetical protein ACNI27_00750 [Desulfovibrio sp.]
MDELTDYIVAGEPGHTEAGPAGSFTAGPAGSFKAGPAGQTPVSKAGYVPIDTRTPRRPAEYHPHIPLTSGNGATYDGVSYSSDSSAAESGKGTLVNASDGPSRIPFPPTSGNPEAATNGDVRQPPVQMPLERPGASPDPNAASPSSGIKEASKALLVNKSDAKLVPPVTGVHMAPHLSTNIQAEGMVNSQNASYISVSHVPQINIQNLPQNVLVQPTATYATNISTSVNSTNPLTLVNNEGATYESHGATINNVREGNVLQFNITSPKTTHVENHNFTINYDSDKMGEFKELPKAEFEDTPKFEPIDTSPGVDFSDSYPALNPEFFLRPTTKFEPMPKTEMIDTPKIEFEDLPKAKFEDNPQVEFDEPPKYQPLQTKQVEFPDAPDVNFDEAPDFDASALGPRTSLVYVTVGGNQSSTAGLPEASSVEEGKGNVIKDKA